MKGFRIIEIFVMVHSITRSATPYRHAAKSTPFDHNDIGRPN
ncbi:hypothetical protein PAMC26510_03060 [Caballeronia sordidicola]|uniref:Uncharacterized protein n=1 Tax=Caballeronia sordidicola TaxID=196367 RepID=A0A2C9XVF9_CABSO|nr:hypothetical protein PAMC26510_03060 [Caballeronia sordidicola]